MNKRLNLSPLGVVLHDSMTVLEDYDRRTIVNESTPTFQVPNIGNAISSAYEQLRNASDYAEDHLLLQHASKRYFQRSINFGADHIPTKLAEELIIELTLSGYLKNNSTPISSISNLNTLIAELCQTYAAIKKSSHAPRGDTARGWILDLLSVRSEQSFNPCQRAMHFAYFAHRYYSDKIDVQQIIVDGEHIKPELFQMAIYTGVHRALLKSDDAIIRSALLDTYRVKPSATQKFIEFNLQCDELFQLKTIDRITRIISKNGAHMRIAKSVFFDKDTAVASTSLTDRPAIMAATRHRIDEQYKTASSKVRSGVIKSIAFLLITKALIGVAIEVPYDISTTGKVAIIPLLVNLILPVLFIASSITTLRMPGDSNTRAIADAIDEIIYTHPERTAPNYRFKSLLSDKQPLALDIIYAFMLISAVFLLWQALAATGFNILQGVIFIVFISTAAFLGYRLSTRVKELEIIPGNQNMGALLRDFVYTPFILIGHQISFRYAKINIVSRVLDVVIEMPLKQILRLLRQWTSFLSAKKEQIL